MKKLNKNMIQEKGIYDLYYSKVINEYYESNFIYGTVSIKNEEGYSKRVYREDGSMSFYYTDIVDENEKINFMKKRKEINVYENFNLNSGNFFKEYKEMNKINFVELEKVVKRMSFDEGINIKKIYLQRNYKYFEYLNCKKMQGNGIEYVMSPGILVKNPFTSQNEIYFKTIVDDDVCVAYQDLLHKIRYKKIFEADSKNIKYIYMNSFVFSQLINCFFSTIIRDEYGRRKQIKLSSCLNVFENSVENISQKSDIDEDGNIRKEYSIIKNGCLDMNFVYDRKEKNSTTGNRINYRSLPQYGYNKVYIKSGNNTLEEEMKSLNKVMVINGIQGMEESYNIETTEFQALIMYEIYEQNEYRGSGIRNIETSLLEIFNRIEILTNESEYEYNGKIKLPGCFANANKLW